ncbi:anti-virulence regulator CigR family protein [Pseudomonas asplenii]|uniref:anti-virulence regulator CigR family protein n=1 Tax=Pseudomonas asplenii TaxID=53407 RepID=UPI0003691C2C|nr:anti-virulence regulator CigR family protein [Pseudomonas fuscovaginae]
MRNIRLLTTLTAALVLAAGSASAWADPGNGQGNGKKFSQGFDDQDGHGKGRKSVHGERAHGPSIDRNGVLGVLGGYRDYWSPGPALPPGIRKNLARGKPLPPGIAKKLDGRLLGQLPRYDGYEWRQAGADLILVSIASGIIYEVLSGAFD